MNLDQALYILEVNDPTSVTIDQLARISKRAKKRWHPDRIPLAQQDPKTVQYYQDNFVQVELAVEVLQSFIEGKYHAHQNTSQSYSAPKQESNEEILRRNAPMMQTKLREIFDEIVARKFMFHQEDVILSEGDKIGDLLQLDLSQKMPFFAALSFGYALCISGLMFLIIGFAGLFIKSSLFVGAVGALVFIWLSAQTLVSFIGLLPMSRFWLPPSLSDLMVQIINFPILSLGFLVNGNNLISGLLRIIINGVAFLINIIAVILYQPAILLFGNRVIRRVVRKQAFYANYADWYVKELAHKPLNTLSVDELFKLGDMYTRLSRVETLTNNM